MKNTKRVLTAVFAVVMIAVMAMTLVSCGGKETYTYKSSSVKVQLDGKDVTGLYSEAAEPMAKNTEAEYKETTATVSGSEVVLTAKSGEKTTIKVTKKDGKLVPTGGSMDIAKSLSQINSATGGTIDMYFIQEGSTVTMVITVNVTTTGQTVSWVEEVVFSK